MHSRRTAVLIAGLAALLGAGLATDRAATALPAADAEVAPPAEGRVRTRAERLIDRVVDGEPVTFLIGDVFIERDSLTVAADSALHYRATEEFDAFGNVRLTRGDAVLTCEHAYYNDRTRDADFDGDVRIVEDGQIATSNRAEMRREGDLFLLIRDARVVTPDYVLHADTVARYEDVDAGEAWGHVVMVEPGGASVVTGGHAVFDNVDGRVTVDREPQLESRDQGADPLFAEARVMDFLRSEDLVVMVDSVRIRQGRMTAAADTARIFGRERVRLTGGPPVMEDGEGSVMTAEAAEYLYADGELKNVVLEVDASVEDDEPADLAARYRGLPGMDVLTGDTITVEMADGAPLRSLVLGNAHSVYVPVDAAKEVAYNDVSGDTIVLAFRDRRVHQVDVHGNMVGTYSFVRLENIEQAAVDAVAALDSILAEQGDSLAVWLPDTLATLLPEARRGWAELDPATGAALAMALADSLVAGRDSVLADAARRALATTSQDTTAEGESVVDFAALREFVDYGGDAGIFDLAERQIAMRGNGTLKYGTLDLAAGDIRLDTDSRELYASERPLLIDGPQKIAGNDMAYDFGNRTGAVRQGATTMDDYFYVGDTIKRFGDGDLKIRGGHMTSCELADPHYHFWADRMKIQLGDKVVAKPIVMRIGQVPVFALPFYFKALETGRRSGIIFPNFDFGWGSRTGRYIRDWGYYWATNDYTDLTFRGDYNEHRELTWEISNRYVKRYAFDGNARYSRRTTFGSNAKTREWQLRWKHSQPALFDEYRFSANLSMSSKTVSRQDLINDLGGAEVINGQQTSNVSVSRNWSAMSASMAFKRDEYVNASDDDPFTDKRLSVQHFPKLTASFKSRPLMSPLRGGRKGSFLGNLLRETYVRHSYSAGRTTTDRETTRQNADRASGSFSVDMKQRVTVFTMSSGVSAGFDWSRDEVTGDIWRVDEGDTVYASAADVVEESSKSLSVNSSASTTLYGLFGARLGSLRGIRHTMRFNMGHSWRPRIEGTQESDQRFSFRLGNRFDLKFLDTSEEAAADSVETFRKLDGVVDWSLSTGYDPDKDPDQRWSTISSSLTLKPGTSRHAKVTVTNTIDPYELSVESTRFTYGLGFNGRFDTGGVSREATVEKNEALEALAALDSLDTAPVVEEDPYGDEAWADAEYEGEEDEDAGFVGFEAFGNEETEGARDDTEGGRYIPWRMSSNFSYSRQHDTDNVTARLSLNASATLTRTWKASWRGNYDLESGRMTNQSWNLEKDLHCWSMRFSRTLTAVDSQFGFVIALKAIPDIKVTKGREDLVGGLGGMSRRMY